jgi:hypothetical protein
MRPNQKPIVRRLALAAAVVTLMAACADDESPGGPTISLHRETVLRDPTPTTAP